MKLYDVEATAQTTIVNTGQTPPALRQEARLPGQENIKIEIKPKGIDNDFF